MNIKKRSLILCLVGQSFIFYFYVIQPFLALGLFILFTKSYKKNLYIAWET